MCVKNRIAHAHHCVFIISYAQADVKDFREKIMDERTILHSDLNNFYASVECMLRPELNRFPVAVCGRQEERHGIVLAKNYAAKAYGVQTGEPIVRARAKCPALVCVDPHFGEYVKYSRLVRQIYMEYSDLVEPYGMDENFIDVSASLRLFGDGETIAHAIRERVRRETGLTVSVGVSFNKIFAKLGSDMKKPDAVTCIPRESFRNIIWSLPAGDMLGVGRTAAAELHRYGITTIGALAHCPDELLIRKFGVSGLRMKQYANGEDTSAVLPADYHAAPKSVSCGITFRDDLREEAEVWPMILALADEVAYRLREADKKAQSISLTVKDCTLKVKEWQVKLPYPTHSALLLATHAFSVFRQKYLWIKPIRMLCVRAIRLQDGDAAEQLTLLCSGGDMERTEQVDRTVDEIRRRFGKGSITSAATLRLDKMPRSPAHTDDTDADILREL